MEKGFKINQYYICVANKLVKGKQCSLVWYVNNKKVSHMKAKVVEDLINDLKKHFGELAVTRGKKHTFWGMNRDITEKVEIDMKEQFLEAIEELEENIDKKVTTPASSHLLIFNEKSQQLDEEKSEIFHLMVMKLLQIMRR